MSGPPPLARHLLATFRGCPHDVLDDEALLGRVVAQAAGAAGATVLQVIVHHFAPQGITALALLAESHASLHTYPEQGVAFWDCFTCGISCDPARSLPVLVDALQPAHIDHRVVLRGVATGSTALT